METITSTNGTRISFRRSGEGPPLVLVHGTTANHARWAPVLPAFGGRFTVYAVDRRGYGESGDSDEYEIEREFEDVASLVDSIGEPANLLGHSFGALCALGAALLTENVRRLVLYEPMINIRGGELYPPGLIERMEAMLDAGDREGIVAAMIREMAGMSPEEVEIMRSQPIWRARVEAAHAIPRESRAEETYHFDSERFGNLDAPTMLLLGGESPKILEEIEEAVNAALPDSRIVVMPGEGHVAMDTATDLFTSEVVRFLTNDAKQTRSAM